MNTNVILAKCLAVTVLAPLMGEHDRIESRELVKDAMSEVLEANVGIDVRFKATIDNVYGLIKRIDESEPGSYSSELVSAELETVLTDEDDDLRHYLDTVISSWDTSSNPNTLRSVYTLHHTELKRHFQATELKQLVQKASRSINETSSAEPAEMIRKIADLKEALEESDTSTGGLNIAAHTESFSTSEEDRERISAEFEYGSESVHGANVYTTGIKRLNRGLLGGLRAGDFALIAAKQHNHKSGLLRTIMRGILKYNDPKMFLEKQDYTPSMSYIGFEDKRGDLLMYLYGSITCNNEFEETYSRRVKTGDVPQIEDVISMARELKGVDTKSKEYKNMADITMNYCTEMGWHVDFERINPDLYSYSDIVDYYQAKKAERKEMKVFMMDYLTLVNTRGCDDGAGVAGTALRSLVRKTRALTNSGDTVAISPVQMSPSVKGLAGEGITDEHLLASMAGNLRFSGSGQLDQDPDIVMAANIVKKKIGELPTTWLNVMVDKHRINGTIPDADKNFFIPFPRHDLPLLDDAFLPEGVELTSQRVAEFVNKMPNLLPNQRSGPEAVDIGSVGVKSDTVKGLDGLF